MKHWIEWKVLVTLCAVFFVSAGWAGAVWGGETGPVTVDAESLYHESDEMVVDLQIPVISGMQDQEIQKALNDLMKADLLSFVSEVESGYLEYLEDSKTYEFDPHLFSANADFTVSLNQAGILSIPVVLYQYTGGAHGMTYQHTYNFNLATGETFQLGQILSPDQKSLVSEQIKEQMAVDQELYFDDAVAEFQAVADDQSFYLIDYSLVVYFELYELGPYVIGIPEFTIPMTALSLSVEGIRTALE